MLRSSYVVCLCVLQIAVGVKVKVFMHSEETESKGDDNEGRTEMVWDHKTPSTMLPFLLKKNAKHEEERVYEEETRRQEKAVTEKTPLHPNEVLFPLIYKQSHINSMFMFGQNWYTWSTEKRTDGSNAVNYYICYDEPKHCDDVGWERTDTVPKCAFQIDSLMPDDRACLNPFGVEPHITGGCDGGEQMKVSDIVNSCGPRIRSLWRFVRVNPRPPNAAKPADVNSLICEDEEECVVNVEYRIHHDRITFSLHEPTRGQTFKSSLKRDLATEEEAKVATITETHIRVAHKPKKIKEDRFKAFHVKTRAKAVEGKGVAKEKNDSSYTRRAARNKIKVKEDISDDMSE